MTEVALAMVSPFFDEVIQTYTSKVLLLEICDLGISRQISADRHPNEELAPPQLGVQPYMLLVHNF